MTPSSSPSGNWLVFGSETEPIPPVPVRAGPLEILYEPASGFIRRVCLGQHEVLRGIYAAVRDCNWGTVPGTLRETRREATASSFHIEFDCEHRQGGIHFVWHGAIWGLEEGCLRYEFSGEARSTFLRNRIGFCVLHPIRECCGAAARQKRVDGHVVECRFPEVIEPQIFGESSFRDLRGIAHEIAPGLWAEVDVDGEVFETEDQRNWTDASFKTYCTPLVLPFPVEIKAGTRIRQSVTLRLVGPIRSVARAPSRGSGEESEVVTVSVGGELTTTRRPAIGLGIASHGEALAAVEVERLHALGLAHLRVDLHLSAPDWPAVWERASLQAEQLDVGLELALHLPRDGEGGLTALRRRLETRSARMARVLALREGEGTTSPGALRRVREALAGLDLPIGAGSDAHFCELNRDQALGRLPLAEADFIFWSMNPQVHASDPLSVMETLEAQADAVRTARAFAVGKPFVVSPVTLKPRFNAVATRTRMFVRPGELPAAADSRQSSLFAAAWTLGTLATLSIAGVSSLTLFETTGWQGVMEREAGSPLPERFPSLPGAVYPVYHLLAGLTAYQCFGPMRVSAPRRIAAFAVFNSEGRRRLLLGNLTPQTQRVRLHTPAPAAQVIVLDADSVKAALQNPKGFRISKGDRLASVDGVVELSFAPYALSRITEVSDDAVEHKPRSS